MYFLMICRHKPGIAALRDELRPKHREYVAHGGGGLAKVLTGSALRDGAGLEGVGHFGVIEAENPEKARAFTDNDPFTTGGVVDSTELIRLPDSFQAHRIDPMTK